MSSNVELGTCQEMIMDERFEDGEIEEGGILSDSSGFTLLFERRERWGEVRKRRGSRTLSLALAIALGGGRVGAFGTTFAFTVDSGGSEAVF